jgi:hypothetical protein
MSKANERHPSASDFAALASGELAPAEQARIAAHVDACERCTEVRAAVLEAASKFQAGCSSPAPGSASDARPQSERLPLSPDHEHLLTMLASSASLKTLAGELHVSVARLRRQVREAREFICDHNPRLLQRSYRAIEASLGTDEDGDLSDDGSEAAARSVFVDAVDRTASAEYLARRFGAVNVGIHRAVYSADDDAEWERVLWALLHERAAPDGATAPVEIADGAAKAYSPATTEEAESPPPDGATQPGAKAENAADSDVSTQIDMLARVERPADVDLSKEAAAGGKGRRARGRR